MYQKSSIIGLIICLISFVVFGFIFVFRPFIGYNFFPLFPIFFIFIFIIIGAAASIENSKSKQRYYYKNFHSPQIPLKNPYIRENVRNIEIQEDNKEIIQPQYCQYCGVKIERDANYCHNCGTKLSI